MILIGSKGGTADTRGSASRETLCLKVAVFGVPTALAAKRTSFALRLPFAQLRSGANSAMTSRGQPCMLQRGLSKDIHELAPDETYPDTSLRPWRMPYRRTQAIEESYNKPERADHRAIPLWHRN
jgi:hypothetical protein